MNAKERTLYFAAVCLMLFSLGILLLAFAHKAHAATQQGSWSFDGSGNITSIEDLGTVSGDNAFLINSLTYSGGNFPVCAGGRSGSGTLNPTSFIGLNIYSDGGLGTSGGGPLHDCTAPGNYYFIYGSGGTSPPDFFYELHYDGTNVTPVNPATPTTYITLTAPTQGTTTQSNTLDLSAAYNIGDDISSFSLNGSLPNRIGVQFFIQNVSTNEQIFVGPDFTIASTSGQYTYATTTTLATGDYTVVAQLVGDYGTTAPPTDCTPILPFVTCNTIQNISILVNSAPPVTFSLNNGTFPLLGFQVGSTTSRNGLATTTCDVVHIGGCFQNALAFLFFPSPGVLDKFQLLWGTIQNKPPFGYVSQTIIGLRSINASSTPAFSFGDIPLVSTIFTPFRTGLAGILWIGFFIAWYRGRLRHLDI